MTNEQIAIVAVFALCLLAFTALVLDTIETLKEMK